MAKSSSSSSAIHSLISGSPTIQIKHMSEQDLIGTIQMFNQLTGSDQIPDDCDTKAFYSHITDGHLRQLRRERGRLTYLLCVKPAVANVYGFLHGGFVAAVAELLSIACARTVVGEDKKLFIGELSISYLSGAPENAEVIVDASVLRSGRSLSVVEVEFRLQKTGKLVYTARSTLYNLPMAKL